MRILSLLSLSIFLAVAICVSAISAKVAPITLKRLVADADIVAVGNDIRVFEVDGWSVAELEIQRVLKGDRETRRLYYLATPTWTCDISGAKAGEESLLFLDQVTAGEAKKDSRARHWPVPPPVKFKGQPVFWISHAGRGRMPITTKSPAAKLVHIVTMDVELPEALAAKTVEAGEDGTGKLPLELVEGFVLESPPTPSRP